MSIAFSLNAVRGMLEAIDRADDQRRAIYEHLRALGRDHVVGTLQEAADGGWVVEALGILDVPETGTLIAFLNNRDAQRRAFAVDLSVDPRPIEVDVEELAFHAAGCKWRLVWVNGRLVWRCV